MSTKEVTHQDVIDYVSVLYNNYKVHEGKLHITWFIPFCNFKYSTLPRGMVFESACDLSDSGIKSLPDDLVLYSDLYLDVTKNITVPAISVRGDLYTIESDIKLLDGIYVGCYMYTRGSRYEHLNTLYINGYIFGSGVLS